MTVDRSPPSPVRSAFLDHLATGTRISHGFFSRTGGVSRGLYRGLNVGLGSADDRADVMENRSRVSGWFDLSVDRLVTVHQVHSPTVHIATLENRTERPKADALVTRTPGLLLGVLTADCGPVLFADPEAGVIGAAHAGWRGAFDGVVEATIAAMQRLGADPGRIAAVLGPSISQSHYEVGPEFIDRFIDADPTNTVYFRASDKSGHALFDLRQLTVDRLSRAGVKAEMLSDCTYADEEAWYSYRRATHRNEPDYGRQVSAITIKEDAHGPAF
ncbi:peptidoglycan editing factor PgeF [Hoeflea sp. YIM 152468]|uniref:peptidoglycan editing factor PgeF n=1 Tax=Hoeflea sp. YIM 152468 TaxID=3031759 RepID=UPI0023DA830E|nr:peptidoglycan editing factor PgeF [Hoeflea sp. YIM 152468]MDF1609682.1 peptidoglycan editing factor PgeF [Hoeflea sp. YIM 152468]